MMVACAGAEERNVKQEQKPSEPSFLRELIVGWKPTRQQVLWAIRVIIIMVVLLSILTLVGSQFEESKSLWYWL
jgi:small-conductance mechanosensitive channel